MTRIYRYILETDCGMAPCIDDGMISLATCKPGIRKHAQQGDWVAGFWPGSDHRGLLVWAGRVGATMSTGDYQRSHPNRQDAAYEERTDGGYEPLKRGYHCGQEAMDRDTDHPVLLFDRAASWYWGARPRDLPPELRHLRAAGRQYRVNFRQEGDLERWIAWLGETSPGIHGAPRDALALCPGCVHCQGNGPPSNCGQRRQTTKRKPKGC